MTSSEIREDALEQLLGDREFWFNVELWSLWIMVAIFIFGATLVVLGDGLGLWAIAPMIFSGASAGIAAHFWRCVQSEIERLKRFDDPRVPPGCRICYTFPCACARRKSLEHSGGSQ